MRVEFARPKGNTIRNATKQTVDITRTAVPFLLALGMRRFAATTPASTSTHSHMTGVNSDRPMGNHTRKAIARARPAIRSGERTPRSSDRALRQVAVIDDLVAEAHTIRSSGRPNSPCGRQRMTMIIRTRGMNSL